MYDRVSWLHLQSNMAQCFEDISKVSMGNDEVVFLQATYETKDGSTNRLQSLARLLVPPTARPRQFSPSQDHPGPETGVINDSKPKPTATVVMARRSDCGS